MNLTDCINRLPQILRGRFSSSNNASWLQWAADGIAQIERISIGPGNKRTSLGWQMPGGFIPMPAGLVQITNAWLDGVEVKGLSGKIDKGFAMQKDSVTFKRVAASAVATQYGTQVILSDVDGDFPSHSRTTITAFDGSTRAGSLTVTSGEAIEDGFNKLSGFALRINEGIFHIDASLSSGGLANFTVLDASSIDISSPLEDQVLIGPVTDSLAGCEFHSGHDSVQLATSAWIEPYSTPGGWSSPFNFQCDRLIPGRSFALKDGYVVKSNLVVEGYRALPRPADLFEELDLPEGTEGLLSSFLWWKAEESQDPGSRETQGMQATFEQALRRYAIDQSRTDGATRPTAYQFTPSLGMRTR